MAEGQGRGRAVEPAVLLAPIRDGAGHPANQLPQGALPPVAVAVEIFGGDNGGGRGGPGLRKFDPLLLEEDPSVLVGDDGVPQLPLHLVEGVNALTGEHAGDAEAGGGDFDSIVALARGDRGGVLLGHGMEAASACLTTP